MHWQKAHIVKKGAGAKVSLSVAIAIFLVSALVVAIAGTRMTDIADRLADRTGMGEALTGGLLLGMSTSLSGTVTSITAALEGQASLAASNAIGGIAVQTVFLVIADMTYRGVNLERAGPDVKHLLQGTLLILMLALPLIAYVTPPFSIFAIHPISIILFVVYVWGMRLTSRLDENPTWQPQRSRDLRVDAPEPDAQKASLTRLGVQFAGLALVLAVAGYAIAVSGAQIAAATGLSQSIVGTLFTSTATSLPELVTTLAAVRRRALQLAIGGIVGGNTFDILFLTVSDIAYRDGSLYHAMQPQDALVIVAAIIISAILLMGLIARDKWSIGFEGVAILGTYAGLIALQIGLG